MRTDPLATEETEQRPPTFLNLVKKGELRVDMPASYPSGDRLSVAKNRRSGHSIKKQKTVKGSEFEVCNVRDDYF